MEKQVSEFWEVQFKYVRDPERWTTLSSYGELLKAKEEWGKWGGLPDYRLVHFIGYEVEK